MAAAPSYAQRTRAPRYSVLFALPLLALYELLAFTLSGDAHAGVRNGADVLLKGLFVALGGGRGLQLFGLLLVGGALALVLRDLRRHGWALDGRTFLGMFAESVLYAFLVGGVTSALTGALLGAFPRLMVGQGGMQALDLRTQLVLSLGAGLYEELLFRVLLVSGLAWVAGRGLGWRPAVASAAAVAVSALVFSAFHYVGPYGDPLELGSFTFRAIAGLLFSALYVLRGFGIAAWTHALYDVVVTLRAG